MKSGLPVFFSLGDTGDFNFLMYALSRAYSLQDDVVQRISKYAKMRTFLGESGSLIMM